MKRVFLIPIVLSILAGCATANPACIDGNSLQQYITSYNSLANACSIGDKLFFGFTYTSSATGGATAVPASSIHVASVLSDPLDPGIQFQIGGYFAGALQSRDGTIGYSVVTDDSSELIDDADLTIVGSITRGTGSLTGTEHLYFPGTSTDIDPGSPIVDIYPVSSFTHINFVDFGGPLVRGLDILTAIHVAADAGSFATMSAVEEHFSQEIVPEPYGILLVGSGLLCVFARKLRLRAGR
jgi:hypothetical protein